MNKKMRGTALAALLVLLISLLLCSCSSGEGGGAPSDQMPKAAEGLLQVGNLTDTAITSLQFRAAEDQWGRNVLEEDLKPQSYVPVKLFGGRDEPENVRLEVRVTFDGGDTTVYTDLPLQEYSHLQITDKAAEGIRR